MANDLSQDQLIEYQNILLEWIVLCENTVKELDNLDEHFNKISKAKIGGSVVGIVGSIICIVGFGLSFVTFGASLGLTFAGKVYANETLS